MNTLIRISFLLITFISIQNAFADTIVLKNGTSLTVYNLERGEKSLIYTETNSEDAPMKKIPIEECFAVKIGDGELVTLNQKDESKIENSVETTMNNQPTRVEPKVHPDNQSMIATYNTNTLITNSKPKDKIKGGLIMTLWGITQKSILRDDNLRIEFEYKAEITPIYGIDYVTGFGYEIALYNETDQNIYVDLTNSFRYVNGSAKPFFSNKTFTQTSGKNTGVGINVGAVAGASGIGGAVGNLLNGVNVGGGNSKGTIISTTEQPIILIPPHSRVTLPLEKTIKNNEIIEVPESYFFANTIDPFSGARNNQPAKIKERFKTDEYVRDNTSITATSTNLKENQSVSFSEIETPKKYKYLISYSTSPDFSTYTSLPVEIYLKGFLCKYGDYKVIPRLIFGVGDILKK